MASSWRDVARIRRAQEARYERNPVQERLAREARAYLRENTLDATGSDADVIARANAAWKAARA
jgi:hypothetical protein